MHLIGAVGVQRVMKKLPQRIPGAYYLAERAPSAGSGGHAVESLFASCGRAHGGEDEVEGPFPAQPGKLGGISQSNYDTRG